MKGAPTTETDPTTSVRRNPTVIVARRVRAGLDREFEKWQHKIVAAAKNAPGHLGSEIQAPNRQHPGEWVVIYQFADRRTLEQWLRSPERLELLVQAESLVEGQPREQIIAIANHDLPVTGIASFRLTDEGLNHFDDVYFRFVEAMSMFPGFLRSERFEEIKGEQEDTIVTFSFGSREQLDQWLHSDVRRDLSTELAPFLQSDRTVNVVGGFGGWFDRPDQPTVKRWKQASLVLLGLYPTALAITTIRNSFLPKYGMFADVLIGNVAGVALLTWIVMPVLTRVFDNWLDR